MTIRTIPVLIERVFVFQLSEGNINEAEDYRDARSHLQQPAPHGPHRAGPARSSPQALPRSARAFPQVGLYAGWRIDGCIVDRLDPLRPRAISPKRSRHLDKLDSNEAFENFKSFHAALIADFAGTPLRAETFYKEAYGQAGTSLRVVQAYGNFLERTGRPTEARQVYDLFLASSEDNPLMHRRQGPS